MPAPSSRHHRIVIDLSVRILRAAMSRSSSVRVDVLEVRLALRCLLPHCPESWPLTLFWDAAGQDNEIGRAQGTTAAFNGIVRQLRLAGRYDDGPRPPDGRLPTPVTSRMLDVTARERRMHRFTVHNGDTSLSVIADGPEDGRDVPILCVHGWPELAHSWRHQIAHFAARGRRIAALDVRGYGESDKPKDVASYTMAELCGDVAAVIDALGGRAILFGHDWGAPIVWQTSLRHADRVAAVAGLSVPYMPMGETNFLAAMRHVHKDRFFYQLYFQEPGLAEAEFEADPDALAKIYHGISGEGVVHFSTVQKGPHDQFLTGMLKPELQPGWMPEEELAVYERAFAAGGWTGPFNRYRAQDLDHAERGAVAGRHITQPSAFVAGALDPVRRFVPGLDGYADPGAACDDFRGATIIDGVGHWVQQEAPAETNEALARFVDSL